MGLGGQLDVVRSVSRMAGSDDLGAVRLGFLLSFADAMAKEPLSTYSFPLSGQYRLGRDHRSRTEVNNF